MNISRLKLLKGITLLLIVAIILSSCGRNVMYLTKKPITFSELSTLINSGNTNDVSLTIYYLSPFILTRAPLSVNDLINHNDIKKIVVDGNHLDLLVRINNTSLIPVEQNTYLNARLYYVFETENKCKVFDVGLWGGDNNSIFVNGIEIEENDIFYDLIMPFLPKSAVDEIKAYMN